MSFIITCSTHFVVCPVHKCLCISQVNHNDSMQFVWVKTGLKTILNDEAILKYCRPGSFPSLKGLVPYP